jgi:hypothetical protein
MALRSGSVKSDPKSVGLALIDTADGVPSGCGVTTTLVSLVAVAGFLSVCGRAALGDWYD